MQDDDQDEIIAFLSRPDTYGLAAADVVAHRQTHGAHVFLAGHHAWKIKRKVRFDYLDFSTLEKREATLQRELEVNRLFASDLYLDLVAIVRGKDGRLRLGGDGKIVEWTLRMRRFDEADLLSARVRTGRLEQGLLKALADTIVESHRAAPPNYGSGAAARIERVAHDLVVSLRQLQRPFSKGDVSTLEAAVRAHLDRARSVLERRGMEGFVRRCHGDLHLDNIVMWRGRPTLFDALEFDESLATIDTLYDLSFLLMDLEHEGHREAANIILNRYLWRRDEKLDLEGLVALPLFLALRAGVRAMVKAQQAAQLTASREPAEALDTAACAYLGDALAAFNSPRARLIAVGGLSGTGKSTLAAAISPRLGPRPGALHLRSDLERKAMLGTQETERLDAKGYSSEASARVYKRLAYKAKVALTAGHTVIVDAVFAEFGTRADLSAVAAEVGAPFTGLWLTAPPPMLVSRVAARHGDASDADESVVARQLAANSGAADWLIVDASGRPAETLAVALAKLGSTD